MFTLTSHLVITRSDPTQRRSNPEPPSTLCLTTTSPGHARQASDEPRAPPTRHPRATTRPPAARRPSHPDHPLDPPDAARPETTPVNFQRCREIRPRASPSSLPNHERLIRLRPTTQIRRVLSSLVAAFSPNDHEDSDLRRYREPQPPLSPTRLAGADTPPSQTCPTTAPFITAPNSSSSLPRDDHHLLSISPTSQTSEELRCRSLQTRRSHLKPERLQPKISSAIPSPITSLPRSSPAASLPVPATSTPRPAEHLPLNRHRTKIQQHLLHRSRPTATSSALQTTEAAAPSSSQLRPTPPAVPRSCPSRLLVFVASAATRRCPSTLTA